MVKITSKFENRLVKVAGASLVATMLAPAFAFAQTAGTAPTAVTAAKGFCANVTEFQTAISGKLAERLANIDTHKDDRLKTIADNRAKRDTELSQDRAQWDQNRNDHYAALLAKASTTDQQTAVATFKTTIETAVTARRAAIDVAIKAYRDGVDTAVGSRQGTITMAAATLKTSMDTALQTAVTDCTAGKDSKTVRVAAMAAIKNARTAFTTSVKGLDKSDTTIQTLAKTRSDAVKKAIADFEVAKKAAEKTLRTAWGK